MRSEELHPDGTYMRATLTEESQDTIYELMEALELSDRTPKERLHTTIMYSKKPCPNAMEMNNTKLPINGIVSGFNVWEDRGTKKNVLVAVIECDAMRSLHELFQSRYGATYDFPEYIPHITLSYDCGDKEYVLPDKKYIVKYDELKVKPLNPIE